MVALLFSIVLIFLLCHSIRLGLNIYEAFQVCSSKSTRCCQKCDPTFFLDVDLWQYENLGRVGGQSDPLEPSDARHQLLQ